jgi:hypothetical protein
VTVFRNLSASSWASWLAAFALLACAPPPTTPAEIATTATAPPVDVAPPLPTVAPVRLIVEGDAIAIEGTPVRAQITQSARAPVANQQLVEALTKAQASGQQELELKAIPATPADLWLSAWLSARAAGFAEMTFGGGVAVATADVASGTRRLVVRIGAGGVYVHLEPDQETLPTRVAPGRAREVLSTQCGRRPVPCFDAVSIVAHVGTSFGSFVRAARAIAPASGSTRPFHVRIEGKDQWRTSPRSVSGRLQPAVIQQVVRAKFDVLRRCYEDGLRRDPELTGRVVVRFVIGRDGSVTNSSGGGDIPDDQVQTCVAAAIGELVFPPPAGGIVTVSYPFVFTPGDKD